MHATTASEVSIELSVCVYLVPCVKMLLQDVASRGIGAGRVANGVVAAILVLPAFLVRGNY
jgi:positive regulator of sigma E activity